MKIVLERRAKSESSFGLFSLQERPKWVNRDSFLRARRHAADPAQRTARPRPARAGLRVKAKTEFTVVPGEPAKHFLLSSPRKRGPITTGLSRRCGVWVPAFAGTTIKRLRATDNPRYNTAMSTLLVSHPACLDHLMPPGHPERPDRLRAIERALEDERFQILAREQAPMAEAENIELCHPIEYFEAIRNASPSEGMVQLDADTSMSPGSFEAALRGVGGGMLAVDEVMNQKASNAFVAVRPPGHHAETARPMGFCLFNNAAITARYAQNRYGVERVSIVDFDVHHGNGSQDIFWADKSVMYCSTHEMPLYPGTGAASERGEHNTIVNAPLSAGDGGDAFREAFEIVILPRLREFKPDFLVISAGFDAHTRDPLANLNLVEADYTWVTKKLMEIADASAQGRIVSLLEGGYDLQGLARSVAAHVTALMGG